MESEGGEDRRNRRAVKHFKYQIDCSQEFEMVQVANFQWAQSPASYQAPTPINSAITNHIPKIDSYLKVAIDFSYFLCLGPFHVKLKPYDNRSGVQPVIVKQWWLQKTVCILVTMLGFFWIISDLRDSLPRDLKNPSLHFRMLLKLDVSISKFIYIKMLWYDQDKIVQIFLLISSQFSQVTPDIHSSHLFTRKAIAILSGILYTGNALAEVITGHYTASALGGVTQTKWNVYQWWDSLIKSGYYNFFIDGALRSTTANNGTSLSFGVWHPEDHVIGILSVIGFLQRRLIAAHNEFIMLMAVVTLWDTARCFSKSLELCWYKNNACDSENGQVFKIINKGIDLGLGTTSWLEVKKQYRSFKCLAEVTNSVFGHLITCHIIKVVLYYAISLNKVADWIKMIIVVLYLFGAFGILIFSADICRLTNELKEWLQVDKNRKQLSPDEIQLFLNDLDCHVASVKISNIMPLTYSVLANVLGITITFFIICVQT